MRTLLSAGAWLTVLSFGLTLHGQTTAVGATSATQTVTVTVATAGTVASISALTQGAPNTEFQLASGGTCAVGATYAANATCTVAYTFKPTRPGQRIGAIVLESNASTPAPLATAPVKATGTGPLATFTATTAATVVGYSVANDSEGAVVDAAGDVFYPNQTQNSIYEIIAGTGGNPPGVVSSASTEVGVFAFTGNSAGLAVDGAGDLFVSGNPGLSELVAGTGGLAPGQLVGNPNVVSFSQIPGTVTGVALDGGGNVFVAVSGPSNVFEILAGTGGNAPGAVSASSSYVSVGSGYADNTAQPYVLAVDSAGNVYVAEANTCCVVKVVAGTGGNPPGVVSSSSTVVNLPGTGAGSMPGVALDSAGNVFVTATGGSVYEIEAGTGGNAPGVVSSSSTVVTVISGLSNLFGIATDGIGHLFLADSGAGVYQVDLTSSPLAFNSTAVRTTSSDSPRSATVQNSGNTPLSFSSIALANTANFTIDSGTTTCGLSTPLVQSAVCNVGVDFSPSQGGADSTNVILTDNSLNVSGSTQSIAVSGTATTGTTAQSISFTQPAAPATLTASETLTATATSGLPVSFRVISGPATVSGTTLTFTGGYGQVVVEADQNGSSTYAAATPVQRTVVQPQGMVGAVSATQTATVTVTTGGTVGAIAVLTTGVANQDYKFVSGGTCSVGTNYAANATCTVAYTFTASRSGQRTGAIVLESNASPASPLATALLTATGVGALAIFPYNPGIGSLGGSYKFPFAVAVDSGGDVFAADLNDNAVKEILAGTGGNPAHAVSNTSTVITIGSGFTSPTGVAVDGAGNVFVTAASAYEILAGTGGNAAGVVSSASTVVQIGSGFSSPQAVAVDSIGNVFVADGSNNALKEIVAGTGGNPPGMVSTSSTVNTIFSITLPDGVAVDPAGNVYVDSQSTNILYQILAGTGGNAPGVVSSSSTNVQLAVSGTLSIPGGIAVDSAGDVFVADSGHNQIKEIQAGTGGNAPGMVSGASNVLSIGGSFLSPRAVVVDSLGNLFVADRRNNAVRQVTLAAPSVAFASTPVGTTSSDSPQYVTLQNVGNATLSFPVLSSGANPGITTNFTLNGSSTCPQVASNASSAGSLAFGALCTEAVSFTPVVAGNISGMLVLTDNSLAASANATTTQTSPLTGTATQVAQTITFTQPTTPVTVNATATLQATSTSGLPVTFSITSGPATLSGTNNAQITYTGSGSVVIAANQAGNAQYAAAPTVSDTVQVQNRPVISWNPSSHTGYNGVPVGAGVLDATSTTAGSFAYTATLAGGSAVAITAASTLAAGSYTLTANFTPTDTTNNTSASAMIAFTVANQEVFVINSGGSVTSTFDSGTIQSSAVSGGGRGAAVDGSGYVWSINSDGNGVSKFNDAGSNSTSYNGLGTTSATAVAIDGLGRVYVTNGNGTVNALTNAGAMLYSNPVAAAAGISTPTAVSVDSAGSLWLASSGDNSAVEIIGVAAPVVAPAVTAVKNANPGTRP